jgi:hypothetical protein
MKTYRTGTPYSDRALFRRTCDLDALSPDAILQRKAVQELL